MTWALDLDGVVWLAGRGIPGSARAVEELRGAGEQVLFLTNNSGPTVAQHLAALAAVGVRCGAGDLVTSAQAAASLVAPGTVVAVVGDEGVREALRERQVHFAVAGEPPEAVVVGRSIELDYWQLAEAAAAVRAGARFIAANTDATFPVGPAPTAAVPTAAVPTAAVPTAAVPTAGPPAAAVVAAGVPTAGPPAAAVAAAARRSTGDRDGDGQSPPGSALPPRQPFVPPDGLLPGAGAVVSYIATAAGRQPEVAGKPNEAMAALVREKVGQVAVMAGDRPDTDGLFALRVGARFGLVLSGVTRAADLPVDPPPQMVAPDLLALVHKYLSGEVHSAGGVPQDAASM